MSNKYPEIYVHSGDQVVERSGGKLIVALLNTCVGVALCDREAGVGGVAHFLLPEPTGPAPAWPEGTYASHGLPSFLEKLTAAGANPNRLEATIAGGAVIGPISSHALGLDIGGRILEVVEDFLKWQGIPIVRSETGGCSGSRLQMETSSWDTAITPLIQPPQVEQQSLAKPSIDDIDEVIEQTSPIPQIALRILRLIQEGGYDMSDLATELKSDQVLCAKVLRLCNSAMIGADRRIDSIDRALLILGETYLLEMVVSASVDSFFRQREGGYALMRGGLYKHAICVATVAKVIADHTGMVDPGTAYTTGLLHDIGKVVLDQYFARFFPLFYRDQHFSGKDFVALERQAIGIDHQETGKRMALNWRLPETVQEAIAYHHSPEAAPTQPILVHIVYLADLLTSCFLVGQEKESINVDCFVERLARLGLEAPQLPEIIDRVPWNKIAGM